MGRILLLSLVLLVFGIVVFYGGSYLVIFWRDTLRRWKQEKEADRKRQLKEANKEFIKATEQIKLANTKEAESKTPIENRSQEQEFLNEEDYSN